jgi:predicted dehydrogenase
MEEVDVSEHPLRVGVVGCGLVSPSHLSGFSSAPDAEVAVVCDTVAARAEAAGASVGAPAVTDHREILRDPSVDAVALLLPHQIHHAVARETLEAGKHVYLEKPFTVHEHEAVDLIALARERDRTLAVAENTRFVHAYLVAERIVRSGTLGEIRAVRGFIPDQIVDEWAEEPDGWKRQPHGAAAIMDCAPHMLYLLLWLFGPVESLQAIALRYVPDVELENHGTVAGRLASGALFSFEFSSVTEYPRGERVEIYGSEGTLLVDQVLDPPVRLYRGDTDLRGTAIDEVPYDIVGWKRRSIEAAARDFVEAVRERRPAGVDLELARTTVRLVECAYASIARGGAPVAASQPVAAG